MVFEAGYVSDRNVGCVGNRVDVNAEVLRDNRCFTIASFGRGGFERQVDLAVEILGCIDRNLIEVRLSYAPGTVCVACASRKCEALWYALDRDLHRFATIDVRQARCKVQLDRLVFEAGYVSDSYVGCVGNRVDVNAEVLRNNCCFTIAGFGRGGFERQVDLTIEILRCINRNLIEVRLCDAPGTVCVACAG